MKDKLRYSLIMGVLQAEMKKKKKTIDNNLKPNE